jgi:hypothetical protein
MTMTDLDVRDDLAELDELELDLQFADIVKEDMPVMQTYQRASQCCSGASATCKVRTKCRLTLQRAVQACVPC